VIAFACIGHWYAQLLFLAPLILMLGVVLYSKARARLRGPAPTPRRAVRDEPGPAGLSRV
jgi:hypothetical protein